MSHPTGSNKTASIESSSRIFLPCKTEVEPCDSAADFRSMTAAEKRFHWMFYTLTVFTAIVVVQLIWDIAVLTTP
jgi:hypothetical protein